MPAGRQSSPKFFHEGESSLNITDVRMKKVGGSGKVKAVGSITVGADFVVHEVKVILGVNGLFVALPSKKMADGTFKDLVHPITAEAREAMQKAVLEKYTLAMEAGPDSPVTSSAEEVTATAAPAAGTTVGSAVAATTPGATSVAAGTATDGPVSVGPASPLPATATSAEMAGHPAALATEVTVQAVTGAMQPVPATAAEPVVATLAAAAENDAGDGNGASGEATGVHEAARSAAWSGQDSGMKSNTPISVSASQSQEEGLGGRDAETDHAGGSAYHSYVRYDGTSTHDTRSHHRPTRKNPPIAGAGSGETGGLTSA